MLSHQLLKEEHAKIQRRTLYLTYHIVQAVEKEIGFAMSHVLWVL